MIRACFKLLLALHIFLYHTGLVVVFQLFESPNYHSKMVNHFEGHAIFQVFEHHLQKSVLSKKYIVA